MEGFWVRIMEDVGTRKLCEWWFWSHSKFVAQLHKDNSGVQPFKTFVNSMRGH